MNFSMNDTTNKVELTEEAQPEEYAETPQPYNPLNLEVAKSRLSDFILKAEKIVEEYQNFKVLDDKTESESVDIEAKSKTAFDGIEKIRKDLVDEPFTFKRSVDGISNKAKAPLTSLINLMKKERSQHQYKKELNRREAEKNMKEEAAKLQAKLDKEAEEKGVEKVKVTVPVVPKESGVKTYGSSGATSHLRLKWVGEVLVEKAVPRDYCSPDQKLIDQAVKMGIRDIPGVKIYEKPISALRR